MFSKAIRDSKYVGRNVGSFTINLPLIRSTITSQSMSFQIGYFYLMPTTR